MGSGVLKRGVHTHRSRKSIFRALFAPLFLILVFQALVFYFTAVYGGIAESLSQNTADVLSERLNNRKYEIETQFNSKWAELDACGESLGALYADYEAKFGSKPLTETPERQIEFLQSASPTLIHTLRQNDVNGIFLILNDKAQQTAFPAGGAEQKYGLCIRDMDQESNYVDREDLLLERAPSSIIDTLGCSLDSWWEAKYAFRSEEAGDFYYLPLNAAWAYPNVSSSDLLYCSGVHRLSGSDPAIMSISLPLLSRDGYPYGVLGVELSVKHLASLLPNQELNAADKCCYVLGMQPAGSTDCTPILGTGVLYNRCFTGASPISTAATNATGGFDETGRGNVKLYGKAAQLDIYNNNSPFEDRRLTLIALVEQDALFAYISQVKTTLLLVSAVSLLLGIVGIVWMSRRFARPITALSTRVRSMKTQPDFQLERLGITEIDQLVDAIEELNRNVGKGSARTEFFSRMSHDMRTPMNAIVSFSSPALLDGVSEAVKDDYLQKIHASGEYLLALINEVLDMTKIESNKTELRMTPVRACRLFDTTVPIIEKLAQQKHILFSVTMDIPPKVFVEADVQHLNQIAMNLLSNAVKFTPEGGKVQLSAAMTGEGSEVGRTLCRITVEDNGIGMDEAFMKDLYTPFEQENSNHEGTGLGLSIARRLVELMGGTIHCQSRKDLGTTFTVTLPLSSTAPASPDVVLAPQAADLGTLIGKRILVCEDNPINLLIVQRLLEKWGVTVLQADNGQAGLQLVDSLPENSLDAILMDVQMPVMNGLEATRAIRKLKRSDTKTLPIIAMTANAFSEDEQASRAAGMDMHLAKPVDPDLLFDTLLKLTK